MPDMTSLFHSPIELAHHHWKSLILPGDCVIDATCGNGHDTLFLAELALTPSSGSLYALDLQADALESTRKRLLNNLSEKLYDRIHLVEGCHSSFPSAISQETVKLVVYNLGYLPGGDKNRTTKGKSTIKSLQRAQALLKNGGILSVTCYPGHSEGYEEEKSVLKYAEKLDPKQWNCCHHRWLNRHRAPSLLFLEKRLPRQTHHSSVTRD